MTTSERFIILASRLSHSAEQLERLRELIGEITDWGEVLRLSGIHRVSPFIYYTLKKNDLLDMVPSDTVNQLKGRYLKSFLQNQKLLADLEQMTTLLKDYKVVLLKGSALNNNGLFPDLGIRPMSDIDVMVYKEQRFEIFGILKEAGWIPDGDVVLRSDIHIKIDDVDHKHLPKLQRTSKSCFVEPHWKFFAGEDDDIIAKEAMDNATKLRDNVYLMSDEMNFAHLCSNFTDGYDMGETLRTLADIHEYMVQRNLDWSEIDRICRKEPLHSRLLTALSCVKWLYDCELPERYITDEFKNVEPSLDFLAMDKIADRKIGKVRFIKETYQKSGGFKNFTIFVFKSIFPDRKWLDINFANSKCKLLSYWKTKILKSCN